MSKEIYFCSKDKKYKCAVELADSCDRFGYPDHSMIILTEERPNGTYVIAQAKDGILETEKDQQIADLQKQLEEKEKRIKELDDWKANYGYTNYEDIYMLEDLQSRAFQSEDDTEVVNELLNYCNVSDENDILPTIKQQLKSQPAEICQKLIDMLTDRAELIKAGLCVEFMFTVYDLRKSVEEILKKYQK